MKLEFELGSLFFVFSINKRRKVNWRKKCGWYVAAALRFTKSRQYSLSFCSWIRVSWKNWKIQRANALNAPARCFNWRRFSFTIIEIDCKRDAKRDLSRFIINE